MDGDGNNDQQPHEGQPEDQDQQQHPDMDQ